MLESLKFLAGMGGLTIGGAVIEVMLTKMNKPTEAGYVGIATTTFLISTVVGCVIKAFDGVLQLGKF